MCLYIVIYEPCMYVCMYVHTHAHTHAHTYIYTYMHAHIHTCIHTYTYRLQLPYCLKLWPGHLFLSSNFSPWPLNETGDYTRLAFISWSFESKFLGLWILMAAGDTCAADLVDIVCYEMDSAICSHRFYKSV